MCLEKIEKTLEELREKNKSMPIIVEGEKDVKALKKLDFTGEIIVFNSGNTITEFCDRLADNFREIIILTDWDRKGGFLCSKIKENLKGRVKCFTDHRRILAENCFSKTLEGLPSWLFDTREKIIL